MPHNTFESYYQKYVVDVGLERSGLFAALRERYAFRTALYPGCFLHVTPSFYIRHIVYIDFNDLAKRLFASADQVSSLIDRRKVYRERAYIQFIGQDFTGPLPIAEDSFDLLIALYASGITQACKRYLARGGLLLTNDHRGEALLASSDPDLRLVAVVEEHADRYKIITSNLDRYLVPKTPPPSRHAVSDQNAWPEYTHPAACYLFQKISAR